MHLAACSTEGTVARYLPFLTPPPHRYPPSPMLYRTLVYWPPADLVGWK